MEGAPGLWRVSNSFPPGCNSYQGRSRTTPCFQPLTNGKPVAILQPRRSGAQRGALENNFGQRFSLGAPCISFRPSPK